MADHLLETRKAMIAAMRADAALTALVPATRIYGEEAPANAVWPFILCGLPSEVPDRASCWDGTRMGVVVHCFAKGPGMDTASAISNAVKRALDGTRAVRGELAVDFVHEQNQIIRDSVEISSYHAISRFSAYGVEEAT